MINQAEEFFIQKGQCRVYIKKKIHVHKGKIELSVNIFLKRGGLETRIIGKKELPPFTAAWMELESIMLSEISQVVKDKYHMISL